MSYWTIKMNDSHLTVKGGDWAWGLRRDAVKFLAVNSALMVRDIVEQVPPWEGKCSVVECRLNHKTKETDCE